MNKTIHVILIVICAQSIWAQDANLTLERIYSSREFSSERAKALRWFDGGNSYTTLEPSEKYAKFFDIAKTNTQTGSQTIMVDASRLIPAGRSEPLKIQNYIWSGDMNRLLVFTKSVRVWRRNTKGDYWVLDLKTDKLTKLGGIKAKPSTLMFAKFSPDASKVAYVREHNLYVEDLDNNDIKALTYDGTNKIINGTFDWAYEEEFGCRDGFSWSPDGGKIAYWRIDATAIRNFLMINNTDSTYSFTIPVQYPKAGEKPSEAKIGVVSVDGGSTTWMNFPGDASNQYLPRLIWSPDSEGLLAQHINRPQNHNRVTYCDVSNGDTKVVYEDKETAWLDVVNDFQYLKDGKTFTWVSQKSGWKGLYLVKDGKERLVSPTTFDMIDLQIIDDKEEYLYYTASPDNATQRYLYRSKMSGKGKEQRLTPLDQPGSHGYSISDNGKYARHSYSAAGKPSITEIISLPDHKKIKSLVSNDELRAKVAAIDHNPVEFFKIETEPGLSFDAYMIKPTNFDASKKYPVLFHVYGEPAGQTVKDSWGGRNYLWHLMLAQQGYIIMSIDNRGTPGPKGREWRKSIYGKVGVISSEDQAAVTKKIIEKYDFVDGERIGIWGWSGGGSMTLNMLFRYPEIYKTGMSVAPVADQLMYDNIYQERYSGVPQLMPESYKEGSPLNFAQNLEGNLLLVHGTGDDNVHYQNSEKLINELIRYNKVFSFMSYPNRSHGIWEGKNTSRHVFEILTDYLLNNLEAGGK